MPKSRVVVLGVCVMERVAQFYRTEESCLNLAPKQPCITKATESKKSWLLMKWCDAESKPKADAKKSETPKADAKKSETLEADQVIEEK